MDRFSACLAVLFFNEGGVSNHPADKGGLTNLGVTQVTYDSYRHAKGLPLQPVTMCTTGEATELYHMLYWTPAKCDTWMEPVDLCVFDTAVNSGPKRSLMILQQALGFTGTQVDGLIGNQTLNAVKLVQPLVLAQRYCDARERFFYDICAANPSQKVFLSGWVNRIDHIRDVAGIPKS